MKPKVGDRYVLHYNKGNINNSLFEIRAVVDKDYYVLKTSYSYRVEHISWFTSKEEFLHKQKPRVRK